MQGRAGGELGIVACYVGAAVVWKRCEDAVVLEFVLEPGQGCDERFAFRLGFRVSIGRNCLVYIVNGLSLVSLVSAHNQIRESIPE